METKHNLRKALLVADGGSTKTDWCLAVPHREPQLFRTRGLNPALLEPPAIREILQTELLPRLAPHLQGPETETHIYYYGAGCLPSVCDKMGQALTGLFPRSTAEVHSDLLGAARALCGHEAGIACILGTGSNSCRYDGQDIVQHVSPLGYILGDEGSGTALGKRLIGDWLKGLLDEELSRKLAESYGWDEADIIRKGYREPEANRFLASFTPFLKTHRTHPDAHRILTDCFKAFFERNIMAYHPGSLAVHFVGSIAAIFHQELEEAAGIYDIRIGNILKEPIDRMVNYHRQKLKDKAD